MLHNHPYKELLEMDADALDALAKQAVKIEAEAKCSTEKHKSSFPAAGKVVCAIEVRLNTLKTEKRIASNTSLASYFQSITKERINNHAQSCAVAFGTYVAPGLITEQDYDVCKSQALQIAASISTAVGGDVEHKAVKEAAAQLKERGKDSLRNLNAILATVKDRKAIKTERAIELMRELLHDGHLLVVAHSLAAHMAYETELKNGETELSAESRQRVKNVWFPIRKALDAIPEDIDEECLMEMTEADRNTRQAQAA